MQSKFVHMEGSKTFAEVGKLPYKIKKKKRYDVTHRYTASYNKLNGVK